MTVSPQLNMVLFCGGRGSASIIREALRWPHIQLTLLVNAYDDGLSTGALRQLIPDMLGPSDFRKNFVYLLDLHSKEQYALKHLLEFRLPTPLTENDIRHFYSCIESNQLSLLTPPLGHYFEQLHPHALQNIRHWLGLFFQFTAQNKKNFDFYDCAIGNLIFAGAYLNQGKNFNAAISAMGQLVHSQMKLVNVSHGENRILTGLKDNGELLISEACIVGSQSPHRMRSIFFLPKALTENQLTLLNDLTVEEKEAWLKSQEQVPLLSTEAKEAIANAHIVVYGPGTQFSSLLPSYRIASTALHTSHAAKACIINLGPDHDIQSLSASDIIDQALFHMGDPENENHGITHILFDNSLSAGLCAAKLNHPYKQAAVIKKPFANPHRLGIHNGYQVVAELLAIHRQWSRRYPVFSVDIFMDMNKRSLAASALHEEFLEIGWEKHFSETQLTINHASMEVPFHSSHLHIEGSAHPGPFPEIQFLSHWLAEGKSEYLVLLTGDGEYRFREVLEGIEFLEKNHFGALFGSRTQSRRQFKASLKAAYGENTILHFVSFISAFLLSFLFSLRYGVIFSDPLTGFRIYRRSHMAHLKQAILKRKGMTPLRVTQYLLQNGIELAELPICYRTFSGFTDPKWRIIRGIKNLLSMAARS